MLDVWLGELYVAANTPSVDNPTQPRWLEIQRLSMSEDPQDHVLLRDLVTKAARTSTRLPILRKALKKCHVEWKPGETVEMAENQLVILDIVSVTPLLECHDSDEI